MQVILTERGKKRLKLIEEQFGVETSFDQPIEEKKDSSITYKFEIYSNTIEATVGYLCVNIDEQGTLDIHLEDTFSELGIDYVNGNLDGNEVYQMTERPLEEVYDLFSDYDAKIKI